MNISSRGLPSLEDRSQLRVFVSYTSVDWNVVRDFCNALKTLGFEVLVFSPNPEGPRISDGEVRSRLASAVASSDLICVVTTSDTIESTWVAFEFQEAAAIVGRVLFVLKPGSLLPEHPAIALVARINGRPVVVRHTVVSIPDFSASSMSEVAIELTNDPHETNPPPLTKRLCQMKKFARRLALADPSSENRVLVEAIPYCPEEFPNKVPAQILFDLVYLRGLLEFNSLYLQQQVTVAHTIYEVPKTFDAPTDIARLGVFRVFQGSAFS